MLARALVLSITSTVIVGTAISVGVAFIPARLPCLRALAPWAGECVVEKNRSLKR